MTREACRGTQVDRFKRRCAIYTRKSSEEGLEQNFNSLDAQREACEAFIASQKHEGWQVLPELYDDGGFSGATMERPALQRLLLDVTANKIDVVVVYKVDRLTRSLSDFAKIVETFDQRKASFVSVTQQFNTTSSMGRLTLNILLSFAQFEREVTGERIRDKIAASKKKGMWMGGQPPLGYDVKDKKLIVNEAEAETVRHIFRRYIELKSVRLLKADLDAVGIVSKARTAADGSQYGRKPLVRGALYRMLQNRIYLGETVHKDKSHPGEHEALVDDTLWNEVQALFASNRVDRVPGTTDRQPTLLAGILFDAQGERMTPTHATKRGTRYRYYVSRSLLAGKVKDLGQRIPAPALEILVTHRIRDWLADPAGVFHAVQDVTSAAGNQKRLIERMKHCAAMWRALTTNDRHALLGAIVARVQVFADRIDIIVDRAQVILWLMGEQDWSMPGATALEGSAGLLLTLTVPARLRRAGKEMRIVLEDESVSPALDPSLVRLLIRANAIRRQLLSDRSLTLEEIAKGEKMVASYATRLFRITLLAPNIISSILNGNQPPELTARKLMDDTRLPLDWNEQRRVLGFA